MTNLSQSPSVTDGLSPDVLERLHNADETMRQQRERDGELLIRALSILHRMATERIGWRRFFSRWYFSDEPLRNDAANLVRQAGFVMGIPIDSKLLGDE